MDQQVQTKGQQTQAAYLYDALVSKFPGLGSGIFQFAAAPQPASWVDGTVESQWDVASTVSTEVGGFYVPGSNFYNAYRDLIMSLAEPNADNDENYQSLLEQFNDQSNVNKTLLTKAQSAYQTWKSLNEDASGNAMVFDKWLESMSGKAYGDPLTEGYAITDDLGTRMKDALAALGGAKSAALADLQKDKITITRGQGKPIEVPAFGIDGNLTKDKQNWDKYDADQWDLDITLTSDATIKNKWKVLYKQAVHQHCLSTDTSASVETSRIITDNHYSLNLKAKGAQMYKINRGTWYDPQYMNPHTELEPGSNITTETLFGTSGALHLEPDAFFVLYKPEMKLTVTTETYKQYIEGEAGVNFKWFDIFGLRFHVDQGSGIEVVKGATTTTVSMPMPGHSVPQIMGLLSRNTFAGS